MDNIDSEIIIRPAWRSHWVGILIILATLLVAVLTNHPTVSMIANWLFAFLNIRLLISQFSTHYMIGPMGIEKHVGIISQNMTRFEYRHIRGANMRRSIMNRILGIGHITISTSGMDEDLIISNIKKPQFYTDLIIHRLKSLG